MISISILKHLLVQAQRLSNQFSKEWILSSEASSERIADWNSVQNLECVFFLSTGRAGTKYISDILEQANNLWVEHSPEPELAHQSSIIYANHLDLEILEWVFLHARLDLLKKVFRTGRIYVETNNRVTFYAPGIANLLPNAKFIHLVRHPGEFVRSGIRRGYYKRMHPEISGHIIPRRDDPIYKDWENLEQLEKIAWQWNETNQRIETFKQSLDSGRHITVISNNLFNNKSKILDLANFISPHTKEKLNPNFPIKKVKNRQKKFDFPTYKDWTTEQKMMLRRQATSSEKYGFKL